MNISCYNSIPVLKDGIRNTVFYSVTNRKPVYFSKVNRYISTLNILQTILKSLVSLETAKPLWMISKSNLEIFNIAVMILFFNSNCQWYIIIMEFIKKITEFESTTHISCPPSVAFNCKVRQSKSSFRYACEIIRYFNACIDVHFHHRDCVCYHWNGAVWRYAFRGVLRTLSYI